MTRVCSGCGLHSCDGRCFTECAADYPPEDKAAVTRKPYVPSTEYLAWLEQVQAKELIALRDADVSGDPLRKVA